MTLPKLHYALFDLTIPSSNQKIKVRQMLAKDEKLLLMAKASVGADVNVDILNAVRQVVSNCIVTPGIDVNKLALFDVEYLFLKLRAISVSNIIKVQYQDNDEMNEYLEKLQAERKANPKAIAPTIQPPKPYEFDIDLDKVEVKFPEDRSLEIDISDGIKLIMKYPDSSLFVNEQFLKSEGKNVMDYIIQNSIHDIIKDGEHFDPTAGPIEELAEFLSNLPIAAYDKIRLFIANLPTINHELTYTNKYGEERKILLQTLSDFFMF